MQRLWPPPGRRLSSLKLRFLDMLESSLQMEKCYPTLATQRSTHVPPGHSYRETGSLLS